jgi:hypothetical protein
LLPGVTTANVIEGAWSAKFIASHYNEWNGQIHGKSLESRFQSVMHVCAFEPGDWPAWRVDMCAVYSKRARLLSE